MCEGRSWRSRQPRVIENPIVAHIGDLLGELGKGLAFVGQQYPIKVSAKERLTDLLFYHPKLRCYVVLELKAGELKPEYTGKLNLYLSAVDDLLRHPDDKPSIGIVISRDRDALEAEYAPRGSTQPMAVSQFELTKSLPEAPNGKLPSLEDIEALAAELRELPGDE